jgi:hypothetical protein
VARGAGDSRGARRRGLCSGERYYWEIIIIIITIKLKIIQ